jgi:hypothetical protein
MNQNFTIDPSIELTARVQVNGVFLENESGESDILWYNLPLDRWYPFTVRSDDDGFYAENEDLSIFGFGGTDTEAIEDFFSAFEATWAGLKDVDDSQLTPDAIELREKLRRFF